MKKKITLGVAGIAMAIVALNSCTSLDLYPDDKVSAGTFWQTEEHAKQGITGVYAVLQNDNVIGKMFYEDSWAYLGSTTQSGHQAIIKGTINSTTEDPVRNKWKWLYEGIARANGVIQNVSTMTAIDQSIIDRYIGEAKFLRAFYYNMLLNYYGGVPIYDETCVVAEEFSNMKKARSTADEVREFIISDLDAAIAVLPEQGSWTGSDKGRATKGAAQSLKGKVLLYAKQYSEAAALFKDVIDGGKYSLYNSYPDLFRPDVGDDSDEMIFAVQNIGGVGQDYGMPMQHYMAPRSSYGSGFDNVFLSTEFVDSYENLDGTPFNWEDWFPGFTTDNNVKKEVFLLQSTDLKNPVLPSQVDKLLEMYTKRDPRMAWTVILPYTQYKGWYANAEKDLQYLIPISGKGDPQYGSVQLNITNKIYPFRKFVAEGDWDGKINNRDDSPVNFPLIRYADVLLMYAECLNETGYTSDAAVYVNKVRARVGMPDITATTKDEMFKAIKHEREVEMAGEGLNYMDYKRWGLLESLNGVAKYELTGGTLYKHSVTSRDYLFPIPSVEIDKNPALEQNPDW